MIYCGKPQTPQRDVAIQKEPHCRRWKCEQKRDSVSRNAHKHVPPSLPTALRGGKKYLSLFLNTIICLKVLSKRIESFPRNWVLEVKVFLTQKKGYSSIVLPMSAEIL